MPKTVKIRTLTAPDTPLSSFDPGAYLSGMDFYESDEPITERDRNDLAQFVHFIAFLALQARSNKWENSTGNLGSTAYRALESHFANLDGWEQVVDGKGVSYRKLAGFLMGYYDPRLP